MILRRLKIYSILILCVASLATFAYLFGFANTIILCSVLLHFAASRYWAKAQAKLIVESQNRLGENDKKLLKRISSLEDRLNAR